MRRRTARVLAGTAAVLALTGGGGLLVLDARLRGSLPVTGGERRLPGLAAAVTIERDRLSVPVIRGRTRLDVARATGFVHAQERFFQMDLLRRRAAGELSALVGEAALPSDRDLRALQLRAVARRAVAALPGDERALLGAYTAGVSAGLAALDAAPFEYLALRATPAPWREEDALLCALSMYVTLQGELPGQESGLGLMHDLLPPALFEFLTPKGTEWDAPLQGAAFVQPSVPGPDVVDLRRDRPADLAPAGEPRPAVPAPLVVRVTEPHAPWAAALPSADGEWPALGSNNWALAGSRTADGSALLANDMHLGLSAPNIWFRASLVYEVDGAERRVTGATLPGAPFVIVGSNGRVAWGFTNSQGDWADLVVLDPDPGHPDGYKTPEGVRRLARATETIEVKGAAAETLEVRTSVFGPVLDTDYRGRRRALAWVALREGGLNAALWRLEGAASVDEAVALAPACGLPNQNLVVADAAGRVGWTILGRIPRRFGHDGRLPASWSDGSRGWDGWLTAEEQPRIVDPPGGLVYSANARVVDGDALRLIGFGGYDLGARQGQIRDGLVSLEHAGERDMLRVQLDDRALFLDRWRQLALRLLTPEAVRGRPRRAEARPLIESWGGRASVDSAGYRIVRAFRLKAAADAFAPLVAACASADPRFDYLGTRSPRGHRQWEGPLWTLVTQQPVHLLEPRRPSWDALLLGALDAVLEELTADDAALAARTWGERNTVLVAHPLSAALPVAARLLDMPARPLPGDSHMPRFQSPRAGASERMAVSPGHEERGYFHMPAGQSGHPRSPHYRDGQAAWLTGEPTPFLPGPAVSVLTLTP